MTQKVHVEVNYSYDRVYPDDVNLSAVVDDLTYAERTYGHMNAQVNVSLVEPEIVLPTAKGSIVREIYDDGSSLMFIFDGEVWRLPDLGAPAYTKPGVASRVEVLYDAGKVDG